MATVYEIVNPAEYMPKIIPLMLAHWEETGFDFAFKPSLLKYQQLWELGLMFAMYVMVDDRYVGYCTACIVDHPHNPEVRMASSDAIYVLPEYRNTLIPGRLMKKIEIEAEDRGAHYFAWHTRGGTPLAQMLANHGYEEADIVMMRNL
jgi:GNAT superfamily N-acetyltransferase